MNGERFIGQLVGCKPMLIIWNWQSMWRVTQQTSCHAQINAGEKLSTLSVVFRFFSQHGISTIIGHRLFWTCYYEDKEVWECRKQQPDISNSWYCTYRREACDVDQRLFMNIAFDLPVKCFWCGSKWQLLELEHLNCRTFSRVCDISMKRVSHAKLLQYTGKTRTLNSFLSILLCMPHN